MSDPALPLLLEPDQLEPRLDGDGLLVVDLSDSATHMSCHVPGAVHLDYGALVMARPPAMGLLPDDSELSQTLGALGVTPETHVVAYDGEGNAKASRLLWTLDVVGHRRFSLLNGGLHAWLNEGHPTEDQVNPPRPGAYRAVAGSDCLAARDYVLERLDDPDVVILDARSTAEFDGLDQRAARAGHIPGAVNLEWTQAIDRERNLRLKREDELRAMYEGLGVTPDKEIITHCHTHHRSSHTYVALKTLGFGRLKGYAGSWSEWGNDPDVPIER